MTRLAARLRPAYAAALLAVALLAFAGVKSNVMQAAAAAQAASTPMCGMAMGDMPAAPAAPGKAHALCDFCVAAAHAPPVAPVPPPLPRPAAVAYVAFAPTPALGPRGPPDFDARARGPPATSLA